MIHNFPILLIIDCNALTLTTSITIFSIASLAQSSFILGLRRQNKIVNPLVLKIMIRPLLFLIFFLGLSSNIAHAQVREHLEKEINKILKYDIHVDEEKVPGYVIGILFRDSVYVFGYGSVDKNSAVQPNGNTIFEIGDVTKVFTGSLLQEYIKSGDLKYDDPLDNYLPKPVLSAAEGGEQNKHTHDVTLLDVVTHTSGLPKMPHEFGLKQKDVNNPYANYTTKDLISFYRDFSFPTAEEKSYLFSNVNFALLGEVLENKFNLPYEALLKEKILDPLDMQDTRIQLSETQTQRMAQGHSLAGLPVPNWEYQSFESSVGLKSTVNDLMKFVRAQLDQEQYYDLHQSLYKTDIDKHTHVGKAWHVIKNKKYYDLIAHAGTTSGHRAFVGFIKETKTAVVVLSNSKTGMNGFGYMVLKMINHHWKKRK